MAAVAKMYVVTQPFTLTYDNGKQTVDAMEGDIITYDGFHFTLGDITSVSPALKTVVRAGEWVSLLEEDQDDVEPQGQPKLHSKPVVAPTRTYNATGGVPIDMSDPVEDDK